MASKQASEKKNGKEVCRYAVVGLGYIAQDAMLPAFAHATENSELTALISGDPVKLRTLGKKYKVEHLYEYHDYDKALTSGTFDAVYIALPNSMHAEYAVRAAQQHIHVLCEKPLASSVAECEAMIAAAEQNDVRLMTAYRLHFEEANLEAIRLVQSGEVGTPRFFSSTFSFNVKPGDIRLRDDLGGGPLWDIGIYCINAARYLFRDEPYEVSAFAESLDDERFKDVHETVTAIMRFSGHRLASFTCSFNAGGVSEYRVIGTGGDLLLQPAYEKNGPLKHRLTINDKTTQSNYKARDQFAPELIHFSECVLAGRKPKPSGEEGLADVRVIEALLASIDAGRPMTLVPYVPPSRPSMRQAIHKPPVRRPELVRAAAPHDE